MSPHAAVNVRPFTIDDVAAWDTAVRQSCNGTLLHTRRYLSYHEDRFIDRSLVIEDEARRRIVGVFPAAEDGGPDCVTAHPGITYGGLVHGPSLRGEDVLGVLVAVTDYYRERGVARLRYKAVPSIYHRLPAQDDLYAMFRLGARRWRCDLSATVVLEARPDLSERRRGPLRKARASGIQISEAWEALGEVWGVVEATLRDRHGATPTHSRDEMQDLHARFPKEILMISARLDGEVVAAAILFLAPPVCHAQYLASNEQGRTTSALDLVIESAIALASRERCRYFDFGTSNTADGMSLNQSLYSYKASFGAGGMAYEQYELLI